MNEQARYSPIAVAAAEALAGEEGVDLAVFLPSASHNEPVLYRDADARLSRPDFQRLRSNGITFVYIRSGELRKCEAVLESKLTDLLHSSDVQPDEKARIVHQVGTSVARDLTDGPVTAEGLTRASNIIDNVIGSVLNDPLVAGHMLHMAAHERTTASHMFVVSALSILLGAKIVGNDHEMLTDLGLAGMMHDVGKLAIDPEILNKPTPLTPEESQLIQQHPIESVRLLGDQARVTPAIRQMILQHHERIDGRGYPIGARGDDLLPGSRILAIIDSFHAMIGRRTYRTPLAPPEANRALMSQAGRQFDADFLACWNELFQRCWSKAPQVPVASMDGENDELSTRHEHRPTPGTRKIFGPRSKRLTCGANVTVKCLYAGRLHNATAAPNEFVAPVHDASRGGLCIYSAHPMYRGEIVHVRLQQGTRFLWVRGIVAWCRQHDANTYRTGLRFAQRISEREVDDEMAIEGITPANNERSGESGKTGTKAPASEKSKTKRESALEALAEIATMRSVTIEGERTAVTLSTSADPLVRCKTIEVLAAIGTKAARQALISLLKDDDTEVQLQAVATAGTIRMFEASYILRQLLSDPVDTVALRAAGALGRLGDRAGLGMVTDALQRGDTSARLAAQAFGEIVGHRFPGNADGIRAARRYLDARGPALTAS